MRAGRLRNHIKILKSSGGRSPSGGPAPAVWSHMLTLWAEVEYLSVKDAIVAQSVKSEVTARCKLRYRDDITSGMRLEHQGRNYEIMGPPLMDNRSGREYMTLSLRALS